MAGQTNITEADLVQFLSSLTGYPVEKKTIFFEDPGLVGLYDKTFTFSHLLKVIQLGV